METNETVLKTFVCLTCLFPTTSDAGPQICKDLKSNHTHLQRPTNPPTYCAPCDKKVMANEEKDNFHVRLEPKRKRTRECRGTLVTQGGYNYVESNMLEFQPLNPT